MAVLTTTRQLHVSVAGDKFIPRFYQKVLGAAVGAVVAGSVLAASQAKALILTGGGTFNVTNQITGNNEDVVLYDGTLNLNPGGVIGNSLYLYSVNSIANFQGGRIDNFTYLLNGTLNISSGSIRGDIAPGVGPYGQNGGGTVQGQLGEVNIYGGNFLGSVRGNISYSGQPGFTRVLNALGAGQIKVYGGAFADYRLMAQQNGSISIYGSNFIVDSQASLISGVLQDAQLFSMNYQIYDNGSINLVSASNTQRLTAASAGSSANVPGPLPILGIAAAFGFSRKLRKRIKLHKSTSAVSTSPGS